MIISCKSFNIFKNGGRIKWSVIAFIILEGSARLFFSFVFDIPKIIYANVAITACKISHKRDNPHMINDDYVKLVHRTTEQ